MGKLKILVIITGYLTKDGISHNLMNYFKYIPKDNLKIDYVCAGLSDPKQEWLNCLKENDSKLFVIKGRKKHSLRYIRHLRDIIRENNYDIVHAHGNSATLFFEMYAAKKEKVKIRIAHSRNTTCIHKLLDKFLRPFFYRYCNYRFACGKEAGEWLFGSRNFMIIPNGNDCEKYKFNFYERIFSNDEINIITLGRVNEQKNHIYFVKVMKELIKINPKFHFYILGEISRENVKNEIDSFVIQNNLTQYISFLGGVDDPEKYLSSADIFVLPSLYEGFPNTLIEAQISGLPCIVSDKITKSACICNDVIQLGIKDDDVENWVKKIVEYSNLNDRDNRSFSNIGILKEKGFDIKKNAENLAKLYVEIYLKNCSRKR